MIGTVTEHTAMEAMIMRSDNTGTDVMLKVAGPRAYRSSSPPPAWARR